MGVEQCLHALVPGLLTSSSSGIDELVYRQGVGVELGPVVVKEALRRGSLIIILIGLPVDRGMVY